MQPSLHPSPAPDRATTKCRKLQTELLMADYELDRLSSGTRSQHD